MRAALIEASPCGGAKRGIPLRTYERATGAGQARECQPDLGLAADENMPARAFILRLRPEPGCHHPVRALRRVLKYALRQCRHRCVEVREEDVSGGGSSPARTNTMTRNQFVVAARGTFKTFAALDLAVAVMTGGVFIKFPVMRRGAVLFIALEGENEIAIRLEAAVKARGLSGKVPFAWITECPRLLDPDAPQILGNMVKQAAERMLRDFSLPIALVVIDTMGKGAGYSRTGDENDAVVARDGREGPRGRIKGNRRVLPRA